MNNAIEAEHVLMAQTVDNSRYSDLGKIFGAIADWINRCREAYAAHNELINCGTEEVARIAYDLGISSDDIFTLASKDAKSADLLQEMLVALGVDPKNFANCLARLVATLRELLAKTKVHTRTRRGNCSRKLSGILPQCLYTRCSFQNN
jgi:hypothetical protein